MKKLILTVAVTVSNFVFAQSTQIVPAGDIVNEVNKWCNTTKTFKTGDNDKSLFIGLLKNIYTDTTVKYLYAQKNPRIGDMQISGIHFGDTISYKQWISTIKYYNPNDYKFSYEITDLISNNGETIYIESIELYTKDDDYISTISIFYNSNNLRTIIDNTIKSK